MDWRLVWSGLSWGLALGGGIGLGVGLLVFLPALLWTAVARIADWIHGN